jgi:hypothetical protein
MRRVSASTIEELIDHLLRETAQAHFLHTLTADEALVMLDQQRDQLRRLLSAHPAQAQPGAEELLLEYFQLRLAAELAWSERAITVLQRRSKQSEKQAGYHSQPEQTRNPLERKA